MKLLVWLFGLALVAIVIGVEYQSPPPQRLPAPAPACTAAACPALSATGYGQAALWGAKADGKTDDQKALNAAFAFCAAHPGTEILLTGTSRAAGTIAIPGGCAVRQVGATAGMPIGYAIVCDLAVTPCVAAGEADRKSVALRGLAIGRAAGPVPPGSVGLLVEGANAVLEDVIVSQSDVCERFYTTTGEPAQFGYTAHIERGFTFACASWHIELVGWPELVVHGARAGYTAPDQSSQAWLHLTGGPLACPTGAGPNTVRVSDTNVLAFNQADGSQAVYNALFDFSGLNDPCNNVQIVQYTGGHVEEVRHLVTSDATTPAIDSFRFKESTWVGAVTDTAVDWIQLDPATQIVRWTIEDDDVYLWNGPNRIALAPNLPIKGLSLCNLNFYQDGPGAATPAPQTWQMDVAIAAPAGSWGRVCGLDLSNGGNVNVTGAGAGGIAVGGNYGP